MLPHAIHEFTLCAYTVHISYTMHTPQLSMLSLTVLTAQVWPPPRNLKKKHAAADMLVHACRDLA